MAVRRPDPPQKLHPEAADEWRKIVGRLPIDWFPAETHAMLETYCVQICFHRRLSHIVLDRKTIPYADLVQLTRNAVESADLICQMATKMRITQQSTHDRKKSKNKPDQPASDAKPWADDD